MSEEGSDVILTRIGIIEAKLDVLYLGILGNPATGGGGFQTRLVTVENELIRLRAGQSELRTQVAQLQKTTQAAERASDRMQDRIGRMNEEIVRVQASLDQLLGEVIQTKETLSAWRNRAIGIAIILPLVAGAAGSLISTLLQGLFN